MPRFDKWFQVRLSADMMAAVDREARARQQTIAAYHRDALLERLKRDGVRLRPLSPRRKPAPERISTAVA
jgi:hypothetical protein